MIHPPKQEWDDLQGTHIAFRKWHAWKCKCAASPHKRLTTAASDIENEIPVMSFDDMELRSKEDKSEKIGPLPNRIEFDRKTK